MIRQYIETQGEGKSEHRVPFFGFTRIKHKRIVCKGRFGCVRFVYNRMLAEKKEYYEKTGKTLQVTCKI